MACQGVHFYGEKNAIWYLSEHSMRTLSNACLVLSCRRHLTTRPGVCERVALANNGRRDLRGTKIL